MVDLKNIKLLLLESRVNKSLKIHQKEGYEFNLTITFTYKYFYIFNNLVQETQILNLWANVSKYFLNPGCYIDTVH